MIAAKKRGRRALVVLDAFCGAGGSSTGARAALSARGLRHRLIAINHWDVAIETHERNHPDAKHVRANVYRQDPRELVPGGKVDLFIASPTCSTFSRALGGRPISWDQRYGRMTPTQVYRWSTLLDVKCLLIENVPEFKDWGPCRRMNPGQEPAEWRPIPEKKGKLFRAWIRRLERLGFKVEHRVLSAADFGDATTRERFFLLGRRDGKPIRWPDETHEDPKKIGDRDLFAKPRKPWRTARQIIDWSILGRSIFDRKKPLVAATLARIWTGAVREAWPRDFLDLLRLYAWALDVELPPVEREPGRSKGEAPAPFLFQMNQSRERSRGHRGVDEPLGTVTGAFLARTDNPRSNAACVRSIDEPTPTATTAGGIGLVAPFVLAQGAGGVARNVDEPVPTIPARGALSFIAAYYRNGGTASVDEPLRTQTAKDRFALVTPVDPRRGLEPSEERRGAPAHEEPLPTVTCAPRGELGLIVASFGERKGQAPRWHSLEKPLPTLCAKGRIQLVQAVRTEFGIDILFRMLTPRELARAMGFPDSYLWPETKTDATKLVGNAVAIGVARALTDALVGATT